MQELVKLFGRETAYVAVQRNPPLLDRDPADLASRASQLLAAVDPRVGGPAAAAAGGPARGPGPGRALARLLEDAPEALDVELGEIRGRLGELSAALGWRGGQVGAERALRCAGGKAAAGFPSAPARLLGWARGAGGRGLEGTDSGEGVERTEAKQGVEPGDRDDPVTYKIITK